MSRTRPLSVLDALTAHEDIVGRLAETQTGTQRLLFASEHQVGPDQHTEEFIAGAASEFVEGLP